MYVYLFDMMLTNHMHCEMGLVTQIYMFLNKRWLSDEFHLYYSNGNSCRQMNWSFPFDFELYVSIGGCGNLLQHMHTQKRKFKPINIKTQGW